MTKPGGNRLSIAFAVAFASAVSAGMFFEFPWVALLPVVAIVAWWGMKRVDLFLAVIAACVPLSINLEDIDITGVGLYLPTEPMLAGLLLLFVIRAFRGWPVSREIIVHPVSRTIQFMLVWIFLTSLTSYDPLVSLKFLAVRAWFVVGFFFIAGHLFLADPTRIRKGVMLYVFPLAAVVLYTVIRHAALGFEKDAGHWVMKPFYKDHTSYGAVLAMVIPTSLALLTAKRSTPILRVFMALAMGILVVGLILSYTRAAWVSLAVAAALYALMKLGIKLRPLLAVGVVVLSFGWLAQDSLLIQLERNEQDSSDNLSEHVESISNVSSDASNLERLNRWSCALALFQERPLLGWGPGTYQFVYAPFQRSEDRTIISTNNADGGNAHSEYLGPMAEQGVLGLLAMLALLAYVLHLGFKLQRTLTDPEERAMAMAVFLGLMTYFVHGFLNNYLDTDKASALFWGFIAMLVVWDIHSRKTHTRLTESAS